MGQWREVWVIKQMGKVERLTFGTRESLDSDKWKSKHVGNLEKRRGGKVGIPERRARSKLPILRKWERGEVGILEKRRSVDSVKFGKEETWTGWDSREVEKWKGWVL